MDNQEKHGFLSIVHWNANSLRNKIEEFKNFVNKFSPDIIVINETKCNNYTAYKFLQIINYKLIHKEREKDIKNGTGGVAIFIKNSLDFEETDIFDDIKLELIAIKIKTIDKKEIFIISYYNATQNELNIELFEKLQDKKFILCGDLNCKSKGLGCTSDNRNGDRLLKVLNLNNIVKLNNKTSTHINFANGSKEILDIVLCSSDIYTSFTKCKVLSKYDMNSDHLPVNVEFNFKKTKINRCDIKNANDLNLGKADWEKFKQHLPIKFPSECGNDIQKLNKFIVTSMLSAAEYAIPIKKSHNFKDSFPDEIVTLIKMRRQARNKAQKTHSTAECKSLYNKLTKRRDCCL